MSTALRLRPNPDAAELARRRLELDTLRADLATRELTLGDLRNQLISFEGRYIRQVGVLYRQLDHWDRRLAALQAQQLSLEELEAALADDLGNVTSADESDAPDPNPEITDQTAALPIRSLFRALVKRIHPDRATTTLDHQHRTRLMVQANDAFRRRDTVLLLRLLHTAEADHTSDHAISPATELAHILQQIDRIHHAIGANEATRQRILLSQLALLHRDVLAAARDGRDLLAEMAARVKGQIGIAMARYERELHRLKDPRRALHATNIAPNSWVPHS